MESDERNNLPSASALSRIIACPGSEALIAQLRKESKGGARPPDADADFGQDVHAILSDEVSEMSVPERVSWVAKQCASIRTRILKEIFGDEEGLKLFVETRFWLTDYQGNKVFSAKPDLIAGKNGTFVYLEYKSLTGFVEPIDENAQALSGCVAFVDDDATRNVNGELEVKEILAAIVQPLVNRKPSLVRFSLDDLIRGKRLILTKLDEAKTIGAPRIPGRQCQWCAARRRCSENAADLMALDKRGSMDIATLTPEMVAQVLAVLPAVKKRIKDLESHAKQLATDGLLPGYELKEQQGARFVKGQEQVQALRNALSAWLTREDLTDLLTIPLGSIREKFIERYVATNRCSKIDAGVEFDNLVTPICQREPTQKRLTRKKD